MKLRTNAARVAYPVTRLLGCILTPAFVTTLPRAPGC